MDPKEILVRFAQLKDDMKSCLPAVERLRQERDELERQIAEEKRRWKEEEDEIKKRQAQEERGMIGQINRLQEEEKSLVEEEKSLKERLQTHTAEVHQRFGFQFEAVTSLDDVTLAFEKAFQIADHLGYFIDTKLYEAWNKGKLKHQQTSMRDCVISWMASIFMMLYTEAKQRFVTLEKELQTVLKPSGFDVNTAEKRKVLTDIIRHAGQGDWEYLPAEFQLPTGKGHQRPIPVAFQPVSLLKNSAQGVHYDQYLALRQFVHDHLERGKQQWKEIKTNFMSPFYEECAQFTWKWFLYVDRGRVIFDNRDYQFSSRFFILSDQSKQLTANSTQFASCRLIWPMMESQTPGALIKKGLVTILPQ